MPFVKIIDGKIEFAPFEIYTEDGKVIELDTKEKCLANGYMKAYPYNKPTYDKKKYDVYYTGYTIDSETGLVFLEYELREKEVIDADVVLETLESIYNEEINKQ